MKQFDVAKQNFQDKNLKCADCGSRFTFTAGEQAYYFSKALTEPRRCQSCRQLRKRTLVPDERVKEQLWNYRNSSGEGKRNGSNG